MPAPPAVSPSGPAIAKRIIELHGGRLWVESRVGAGSTFSFTVAIRVAARARRDPRREAQREQVA